MAERRTLTIEKDYCADWTITDAIREILQNGLDTGTELFFLRDGDVCEVCDGGAGVKMSDFIIGKSSKREDGKVMGQFGEGLKIGCLVFARENRRVYVISLGKRYDLSIQYDGTWQEHLLTIDVTEQNTASRGTTVGIECSEEEVAKARSLFLQLNPQEILDTMRGGDVGNSEILDIPGYIYVNGLAVTKVNSLYGYNFARKDLVNRDRSVIGHSQVKSCIAAALSWTTNTDIIRNLLVTAANGGENNVTEFDVMFTPRKNTWLKVIRALYGNKVCVSSLDPAIDLQAVEKNWYLLVLPWDFRWSLKSILPDASEVLKDKKRIVPFSRLTAEQKEFFEKGKRIAGAIAADAGLMCYPVKIFVDEETKNEKRLFDFSQTGYWKDGVAGVCLQTIKELDLGKFVGTLLHEFIHGNGGNRDNSRDFENDLTDVIATLGLALWTNRQKERRIGLDYNIVKRTTKPGELR